MTNREWLFNKMQNMSNEELAEFFDVKNILCEIIDANCRDSGGNCEKCITNWLKSEHKEKITLSEAERIILENIDKDYKWICRDGVENVVWVYTDKPTKNSGWWMNESNSKIGWNLSLFKHLFKFITWNDSEPYNIAELLEESK